MLREVNLIGYLPQFVQEYREIQHIMKAENPEIQKTEDETEIIKNNQFILSCNIVGIQRFEKLLGITPSAEDTLESRISRVMIRWNDAVPYTYRVLLQKLTTLCGNDFEVIPKFNQYEMEIITHLDLYGQVDELQNLLGYMIPANLAVTSSNELNYTMKGTMFTAFGMALCQTFELTDAFKGDFKIEGKAGLGSALVGTAEVILTDTFNETLFIQGNQKVGSNVSYTENIGI